MKTHLTAGLVLIVLAASPLVAEQCGVCHPEERVAHERSVHSREDLSCTSCHGGRPDSLDSDGAHRGAFRSLKNRLEIPAFCASCHSDLEKMRPYNLAVDQYALYETSQHGRAIAAGETRAAICTDCHGSHEILPPRDPNSSVYVRNLPLTCGRCHGDEQLMRDFGLDPGVADDYRNSVHGKALFDQGNLAAPNCTNCHGVHGAAPPGNSDIDKVCGACHIQVRLAFIGGPHRAALIDAGLPECVACHSNHAIQRHQTEQIAEVCRECHEDGSQEVDLGQKMQTLILQARSQLEEARELVARAAAVPLHVEDHEARLEEAQTYLLEAEPLVHGMSLDAVDQLTRRARSIGEEVEHELYPELEHGTAHLGLIAFWFYLLMTLAILFNYKRRLDRESSES